MTETRPCVCCGGTVTADPQDPAKGVREHQRTPRHRYWSDGGRRRCDLCPVTIPAGRTLCRYCARTQELAGTVAA